METRPPVQIHHCEDNDIFQRMWGRAFQSNFKKNASIYEHDKCSENLFKKILSGKYDGHFPDLIVMDDKMGQDLRGLKAIALLAASNDALEEELKSPGTLISLDDVGIIKKQGIDYTAFLNKLISMDRSKMLIAVNSDFSEGTDSEILNALLTRYSTSVINIPKIPKFKSYVGSMIKEHCQDHEWAHHNILRALLPLKIRPLQDFHKKQLGSSSRSEPISISILHSGSTIGYGSSESLSSSSTSTTTPSPITTGFSMFSPSSLSDNSPDFLSRDTTFAPPQGNKESPTKEDEDYSIKQKQGT